MEANENLGTTTTKLISTPKNKNISDSPPVTKSHTAPDRIKTFKLVSLFCGCGGMDLGFRGDFSFLGNVFPGTVLDPKSGTAYRFETVFASSDFFTSL